MSFDVTAIVSTDGTLCIWSYYDGRCLACAERLLKCSPTMLTILPSGYHVAVAGNHTDIEIVNLKKLKVFILCSFYSPTRYLLLCLLIKLGLRASLHVN